MVTCIENIPIQGHLKKVEEVSGYCAKWVRRLIFSYTYIFCSQELLLLNLKEVAALQYRSTLILQT